MARSSSSRDRVTWGIAGLAVGLILTATAGGPKIDPEVNLKIERNGTVVELRCQAYDSTGVQFK